MSPTCSKCQQNMQPVYGQHHFACHACRTFDFPKEMSTSLEAIQATGKTTQFTCPKCIDHNLQVGMIVKTQVAFCGNCRGYVIDSSSFGFLAASLRMEYKGPDDEPILVDHVALSEMVSCPACLNPMHAHPYHGPGNSVINSCVGCKLTWLDHGELSTIIRAPGIRQAPAMPAPSPVLQSQFNQQAAQGFYQVQRRVGDGLFNMFGDL